MTSSLRRSRSEEHTSELQSHSYLVCRLLLEKKKKTGEGQQNDCSAERYVCEHAAGCSSPLSIMCMRWLFVSHLNTLGLFCFFFFFLNKRAPPKFSPFPLPALLPI